jgi:hypothetical protein
MLGCHNSSPVNRGQATGGANVAVQTKLSIVDVATVRLSVQSAQHLPTPLSVPLVLQGGRFSSVINNLAVGSDYVFTSDARKSDGTMLFHGVASNVTISAGTTAQVTIDLNQVESIDLVFTAPVIDSVVFDANQIPQGGAVHLTAAAHDPAPGRTATLAFVWQPAANCGSISLATATGGSDTTDRTATALYTGPLSNVDCLITLTVTDVLGTSNQAAFSIRVGLGSTGTGNASISARINGAPTIVSMLADPAQIVPGPETNTPGLEVVATDPENDVLNYVWTSTTPGCTAVLGSPNSATTSFSVPAVTPGTTSCTFTVTINDGVWPGTSIVKNTVVSSLTLPTVSPKISSPPFFGPAYQSENTITGGDEVLLAAEATDPAGGTLSYVWTVSGVTGTSVLPAAPVSLGLDPVFTTAATWIAPAGAENLGSGVSITVTATSSASTMSAQYVFTLLPDNGICECIGAGPGNVPVTVACGQSTCGTDFMTYACSASGFSPTGQSCAPGIDAGPCECIGAGPGNVPVTVACGQSTCGTDFMTYACSASGFSPTGQSCAPGIDTGPCECIGAGPGNVPVTVACGQSTCGTDFMTYACSASGFSLVGSPCP